MKDIAINIITSAPLLPEDGRKLFQLIASITPSWIPEKYGNYEPVQTSFSMEALEQVLADWRSSFLWKRRKPGVEGVAFVQMPYVWNHGAITLSAESHGSNMEQVTTLFREISCALRANFACLHLIVPKYIPDGVRNGSLKSLDKKGTKVSLIIGAPQLKRCLPDVFWATAFGPSYVEFFGKEKLLSVPAHEVREIGNDLVYIQLTSCMNDLRLDYDRVDKVRRDVIAHLGPEAFFDPSLGSDHQCAVPDFSIL